MNASSIRKFVCLKITVNVKDFRKGGYNGRQPFCSRRIPIIHIKKISEIQKMVTFIETLYSNNAKKEVLYWDTHSSVANIIITKKQRRLYNIWEKFHCANSTEKYINDNSFERTNYTEENRIMNNKSVKDVFEFCSNTKEEPIFLKKNVIGIYVPQNMNIYSARVNYFYLFQNLKDILCGKLFYDIYFVLPNYIFILSFVDIFKRLIFYQNVVTYAKRIQRKDNCWRSRNRLLEKIYTRKIEDLKRRLAEALEKIFANKKYTKIIYEDSIELCSFLFRFLKIHSSQFIDLHHLYQYVLSLYGVSLPKYTIFHVLPTFFPDFYDDRLVYELKSSYHSSAVKCNKEGFKKYTEEEVEEDNNEKDDIEKEEKEKIIEKRMGNGKEKEKEQYKEKKEYSLRQWDKSIGDIFNCNDDSKLTFFETHLIHMLYLFPLTNKLLVRHKDSEGLNITYKMNELIKKYNLLNSFKNGNMKKTYSIVTKKKKIRKGKKKGKEHKEDLFLNLFYKKLNVNQERKYHHKLIIGKHIYVYIFEMNKSNKHILFRFNIHSENITFGNVLSADSKVNETSERSRSSISSSSSITSISSNSSSNYNLKNWVPLIFKQTRNDLYVNTVDNVKRNISIFDYRNNILAGLIYDEEKNFVYFSDKHVGDIVLCTVKDISPCGKYIYVERYDTKNLIFHFRKGKYINLEKNFDYDNMESWNDETVKKMLEE